MHERTSLPSPGGAGKGVRRRFLAPALCAIALAACSAIVSSDLDELGPPPEACEPGERAQCTCVGGARGTQLCNADGGFESCVCGPGGAVAGMGPAGSGGSGGRASAIAGAGGAGGAGGRSASSRDTDNRGRGGEG